MADVVSDRDRRIHHLLLLWEISACAPDFIQALCDIKMWRSSKTIYLSNQFRRLLKGSVRAYLSVTQGAQICHTQHVNSVGSSQLASPLRFHGTISSDDLCSQASSSFSLSYHVTRKGQQVGKASRQRLLSARFKGRFYFQISPVDIGVL